MVQAASLSNQGTDATQLPGTARKPPVKRLPSEAEGEGYEPSRGLTT